MIFRIIFQNYELQKMGFELIYRNWGAKTHPALRKDFRTYELNLLTSIPIQSHISFLLTI
jgi:hypothetical protein